MSLLHECLIWPIEMPGLKKIVMLSIARNAKLSTGEGSISIQRLCVECGISDTAIRKFVHDLEVEGFFVRYPGKRGVSYRLTLAGRP
ncbi:hypothetical protein [Paraburkholderia phenazinium]|uniref:Uncharacterized protein n=1 Tax=Paraburkholderia phenazinium TaxID=60549 RepID=A0A1N6KP61_9BURK|nr:hypothetical protein [Paraburkholderia phenazinium]SIO58331.1 hypothetical protein SAMN05444165_4105 [Paraburkholderia phenazinium]